MTFRELIEAVDRDMQAAYPDSYYVVECGFTHYSRTNKHCLRFRIYHDDSLPGCSSAWYDGATPAGAYAKFRAGVFAPTLPLHEVLEMCDTPLETMNHG